MAITKKALKAITKTKQPSETVLYFFHMTQKEMAILKFYGSYKNGYKIRYSLLAYNQVVLIVAAG